LGSLPTLSYLLKFLDAYSFTNEGLDELVEDNRQLISASVLGLLFEKINGYKRQDKLANRPITNNYIDHNWIQEKLGDIINDHNNVFSLKFDSIEADDIIACISLHMKETNPNQIIYLVSGDEDFLQLGRDNLIFINYLFIKFYCIFIAFIPRIIT
jgi:hypothetical protein